MTKRFFDISISFLLLFLFFPLLVILYISIYLLLGKPVLFKQNRPGLESKIFKLYKFRTMTDERNLNGELLSNKERTTPFGNFLRKSSLDELPSLINVLKGEMSLVGPRPLKIEYLELYNEVQKTRHDVRPGITGWAQVNGRNSASWEKRFSMDVWYVENQSLLLDIKILLFTFVKVIKRDGVEHPMDEVAGRFKGEGNE